jgi:hypothetical protein
MVDGVPMLRRRLFHFLALFSALLVLTTVIVSRIPTPQCHCLNPHTSARQECPFGKLRLLAGSIVAAGDAVVEIALRPVCEGSGISPSAFWYSNRAARARFARGPPRGLA